MLTECTCAYDLDSNDRLVHDALVCRRVSVCHGECFARLSSIFDLRNDEENPGALVGVARAHCTTVEISLSDDEIKHGWHATYAESVLITTMADLLGRSRLPSMDHSSSSRRRTMRLLFY